MSLLLTVAVIATDRASSPNGPASVLETVPTTETERPVSNMSWSSVGIEVVAVTETVRPVSS